jgi:hypothetical protein
MSTRPLEVEQPTVIDNVFSLLELIQRICFTVDLFTISVRMIEVLSSPQCNVIKHNSNADSPLGGQAVIVAWNIFGRYTRYPLTFTKGKHGSWLQKILLRH